MDADPSMLSSCEEKADGQADYLHDDKAIKPLNAHTRGALQDYFHDENVANYTDRIPL